jgi:hypothetical protein
MSILALAFAVTTNPILLDWRPVVGETHLYSVRVHFTIEGSGMDFNSTLETKVLGVAEDGSYRLSTRTFNSTNKSDEGTQKLPDVPPEIARYDSRGLRISTGKKESDPFSDLLDHLTSYQSPGHPVVVGDTWVNETTESKTDFFGEPHVKYRLAELTHSATGDYARVSYTASKGIDPNAATGSLILKRPTNTLVHLDVVIPHFMPEGSREEARVLILVQEKS